MNSVKSNCEGRVERHMSANQHLVVLTLQAGCHWKTHRFLVNNNEKKFWENFLRNLNRLLIGRPTNHVSIQGKSKNCIPSSKRPHRPCVPPSLLFNGYRGIFY